MEDDGSEARLDRHALVLAVWLAAGVAALVLFAMGFGAGGPLWLAPAFAALLGGFAGHVIVNAVLGTGFTPREVALALVAALAAIAAMGLAVLTVPGFAARYMLPLSAGAAALVAAVVLYLVIRHGPRQAFALFDVARVNAPRAGNRLAHRGGRR